MMGGGVGGWIRVVLVDWVVGYRVGSSRGDRGLSITIGR